MKRSGFGGTPLALALAVFLLPIGLSAAPARLAAHAPSQPDKPPSEPAVRGQPTLWQGDHYSVKGVRYDLVRRVDQIVVQLKSDAPAQAVNELTRGAGPLAGFVPERRLRSGLAVFASTSLADSAKQSPARAYDSLAAAMTRLAAEPVVAWSAPVFINTKYASYAIATDELLVRLRPGVSEQDFFADARFAGAQRVASSDAFVARASAGAGEAVLTLAAALQDDPRILWAEPNFFQERKRQFTPDDPLFPDQWHLDNTGQSFGTPGADAHLKEAWDLVPSGASDIVIAIVDDGPDMGHPDLAIFQNPGEIPANGVDDDSNGYIDDTIGWDFTSGGLGDNNPGATTPDDFHATPLAGVAAGRGNNAQGITGAAFGARIFAARIFSDGSATDDANIASALAYSAGRGRNPGDNTWHGADIANSSWGYGAPTSVVEDALQWAADHGRNGLGTANFFSSGNFASSEITYPASLAGTIAGVIAVGASNSQDVRATYSQFGPQLDLVAPSDDIASSGITSTDRQGEDGLNGLPDLDYTNNFGGTSAASALSAGVGALLLGVDPTLNSADVRALLMLNADKVGPVPYNDGFNAEYGFGRINAASAVAAVGNANVRVFVEGAEVQHTGELEFSAVASTLLPITFNVVSTGTEVLNLGALSLAGAPEFAVDEPVGATQLALGESTTFTLGFIGDQAGTYEAELTLQTNDPQAPAFSFPIKVTVTSISIGGSVFEDWNGNGLADPGDPFRHAATVYLDSNANGVRDPSTLHTMNSEPNLGLVFGQDTAQTSHSFEVIGLPQRLDGLTVAIDVDHSWIGDVLVRLVAPNGQSVTLADRPGLGPLNGGQNFSGTVFDDNAAVPLDFAPPPYTGVFTPREPLGALAGIDPNGTWTLEAVDLSPDSDDGALQQWSLTLQTGAEPHMLTDELGGYTFVDLAPDIYRVGVDDQDWLSTAPAPGFHEIDVTGLGNNLGVDFAQLRRRSIYGTVYADVDENGDLGEPDLPLVGENVFVDANANGVPDSPAVTSVESTPALVIPDADHAGVSDEIEIALATTHVLEKASVMVQISHAWVEQLHITLTAPNGKSVKLTSGSAYGENFLGTVFDDDASIGIDETGGSDAPLTGSFRPVEPLSRLRGIDVNGIWKLQVTDYFGDPVGTFESWTLNLETTEEPSGVSDGFGNYRIDAAPGQFDVRMLLPDAVTLTEPPSGSYAVSIGNGTVALNRDFGFGLGTANLAPVATSLPDATLPVGAVADIATAQGFSDPDGDTLTYSADGLPGVLVIDPATGVISGPVSEADLGEHVITVTATDVHGASVALDFTLRVAAAPIFADGFED
ncbi:S8 family serine peptidase [Chiayiivirga flava]|uniref:Subtilisin-like proprotein convertase family protein n=1 Tax=Chiayiivirga flava TaxID=659595 RepID=A0A7W8DA34_9GAMM|nr:S8 family serine peptidase [Chiayiivirga flava]MBB5208923.1 subtilisin-like proprotein convertase family protein [Chiayiivirga flava]